MYVGGGGCGADGGGGLLGLGEACVVGKGYGGDGYGGVWVAGLFSSALHVVPVHSGPTSCPTHATLC